MTEFCNEIFAACVCKLDKEHEGGHVCACGGSWDFSKDGEFQYLADPGANPEFKWGQDTGIPPEERLYGDTTTSS